MRTLDGLFLTDGGIETSLIYNDGLDLPAFAAFPLLADEAGLDALRRYYAPYVALAAARGLGYIAESPTWRASPRWARELGYSLAQLDAFNRRAIALMEELRSSYPRTIISGCVGPADDGYQPGAWLTPSEAQEYHFTQIATFADCGVDLVTAMTLTYAEEAIGVAMAAASSGVPCVLSFTVETDGRLPSGEALGAAIERVDAACTVEYFMVNCAHPTHFAGVLDGPWVERIRGVRANASTCSHAELDAASALDAGDPADLAAQYLSLQLPSLSVLGGCCGTDIRHLEAIARTF